MTLEVISLKGASEQFRNVMRTKIRAWCWCSHSAWIQSQRLSLKTFFEAETEGRTLFTIKTIFHERLARASQLTVTQLPKGRQSGRIEKQFFCLRYRFRFRFFRFEAKKKWKIRRQMLISFGWHPISWFRAETKIALDWSLACYTISSLSKKYLKLKKTKLTNKT